MENMATLLHFFGGSQGEPWWYFMKKNNIGRIYPVTSPKPWKPFIDDKNNDLTLS